MSELVWSKQTFTVGLIRAIDGGKTENYTETVSGMVAEGTGLGYWKFEGSEGDPAFTRYLAVHVGSGLGLGPDTHSEEEARETLERMTQPFTWDDEQVVIDWKLSSEELQALPCWPDIQSIRRENWVSTQELAEVLAC